MQNLFLSIHPISVICGMLGTPEILILLIIVIVLVIFFSKKSKFKDVIHLKNGSIIHGKIIEQTPNVSIKIQTKDGNVQVFQNTEIEKMILGK